MSEGPPAADLPLQTIMEQQRVIAALREMVAALKERVACLESRAPVAAAPAVLPVSDVRARLHAAALAKRTSERDAALVECDALRAAVSERDARLADAAIRLQRLAQREDESRALRHLAEARCKAAEGQTRRLEASVGAAVLERARWQSLATALAGRADDAARQRALLHMSALAAPTAASRTRQSARSAKAEAPAGGGGAPKADGETDGMGAAERMAIWSTRRSPLPPFPDAGEGQTMTPPTGRRTAPGIRGGRFLVPL